MAEEHLKVTAKRRHKTTLQPDVAASPTNMAYEQLYQFMVGHVRTIFTARVVAVDEKAQRLTVLPLEEQKQVSGKAIPSAPIYNVPYCYEESSNGSIKIAPGVGDIGLCGVCQRDITTTKQIWDSNTPPTPRIMAWPDAVWLRCLKAAKPSAHVIAVSSARGIQIDTPHAVAAKSPALQTSGNMMIGTGATTVAITDTGEVSTTVSGITTDAKKFFDNIKEEINSIQVCEEIQKLKKNIEDWCQKLKKNIEKEIEDWAREVAAGAFGGNPLTDWIQAVEARERQLERLAKKIAAYEKLAETIEEGMVDCVAAAVAKAKEIPDCALEAIPDTPDLPNVPGVKV